ncbi:MAG: outer membrane beta-barrel protein [Saprospiraceae bacterium]
MYDLHRSKSLIFTISILLYSFALLAQRGDSYNFKGYQKQYYFGIALGYNTSNYKVFQSKSFILNDSIRRVTGLQGPGFNIGIISNLNIGRYIDARFVPTFSFVERKISYDNTDPALKPALSRFNSVFVEFPIQFRYKSEPYKDMRVFVTGGIKYCLDVAANSKVRQTESFIKIAPSDFQVEVGTGVQIFFPFFIFSPEIKFSHGLNNVLIYNDRQNSTTVLEKVLSRTFTISLNFEG